jgi:hypothetical protein
MDRMAVRSFRELAVTAGVDAGSGTGPTASPFE